MGQKTDLFCGKQDSQAATSMPKISNPKAKQKRVEFEKETTAAANSNSNDWVIETDFGPVFIPQE